MDELLVPTGKIYIFGKVMFSFFQKYIVTCQAHPVLVKKSESNVWFVSLVSSAGWRLPSRSGPNMDGPKDPWPRVLSLTGAQGGFVGGSLAPCPIAARSPGWVCWRIPGPVSYRCPEPRVGLLETHLAGTRQYHKSPSSWMGSKSTSLLVPPTCTGIYTIPR